MHKFLGRMGQLPWMVAVLWVEEEGHPGVLAAVLWVEEEWQDRQTS